MPIDLGSHMSTGISAFAYWELRRHLGLSADQVWVPDLVQMLAYVDEDIRRRFHLDLILLEPRWERTKRWSARGEYAFDVPVHWPVERTADGEWHVRKGEQSMRMPKDGFFFDGDWLSNWGQGSEEERLDSYAREAERIYKETPYATNFLGYSRGGGFWAYFGGIERCCRMLEDPQAVMDENAASLEQDLIRAGKLLDRLGPYIQLLTISDDMGMQTGPMCRPSVVEQCCAPYIRKFCSFIHQNSDVKVFLHCCGSIKPLIPMLVDCGVDVLNPVQISAANMDPQQLKNEFGDKMIFWGGGCDTQNVLGVKTPQEVRDNVRKLVRAFKPGGGFVFNQVHNVMGNIPPENVVAMLDTAYEEAFYD